MKANICALVGLLLATILTLSLFYTGHASSLANIDVLEYAHQLTHCEALAVEQDVLDHTKVATIVETRNRTNLVPLILHFANVLGPTWPIHVIGSRANEHLFAQSAVFQRYVKSGQIQLTQLDSTKSFKHSGDVSAFLAGNADFWRSLAPADHVLLFQSDSILCSNSQRLVDDFFEYDFVGAPIAPNLGHGYNGGLSLRNRLRMIEIVEANKWDGQQYEDQWFYDHLKEMGAKLPEEEVAGWFAVETIFAEEPLGLHQAHRWQHGENMTRMMQWCPELQLADGGSSFFP